MDKEAALIRPGVVAGGLALLLAWSVLFSLPAYAQPVGLVAAYSFDEGSGTTAGDSSGNGNTGTLQSAVWTSGGKFGSALVFNGTTAKVLVPDSTSLDVSSAMTVEAWVYPTVAPSGWSTVVYKEIDRYYLEAGSDQNAPASGGTFTSGNTNAYGAAPLSANTWTHLATTFDGTALRLFVNGIQVGSLAVTGSLTGSTNPLSIGGNSPYGEYFDGRIDEVRVYNRALSASEIQTDMNTSIGGSNPNGPKLIITGPGEGSTRVGTTVGVTYTTTGDLTEVNHVHFQLDTNPVVMDLSFDGAYSLSGVHVGSHTLNGWLVRSDHSKVAGTDTTPVHFSTVVDPSDFVPPSVSIASPSGGAIVLGTTTVTANTLDNVGVNGVQFKLDGANLGLEDRTAPYAMDWNTAGSANGSHTLTAVAQDTAGNETTSAPVTVTVSNASPTDPSVIGQWAGPFSWPLVAVHATLMPNGKILLYDDHTTDAGVQVWDPVTGTLTARPYVANNLFCSGHTTLPDGRVLVVGGHAATYVGIPDAVFFDPATELWSSAATMEYGRWYPTATSLPSGKVLAISGAINCPDCSDPSAPHAGLAQIPEVYDPPTDTWSELSGASLNVPMYPHMFVLPDGRVLAASTQEDPIVTRVLNLASQSWTVVDPVVRDGGSAVMYRPGKILKTGTARNPDYPVVQSAATAYVMDMTQPSASWRPIASMAFARTQHNLTLLPDGTVLCVGGETNSNVFDTASAVKEAELWSPLTETWTTMARMSEPRVYHSVSLLLPDGRVMVAAGGRFGPDFPSVEIYSPPYLFRGARPVITSAPGVIPYGSHVSVGTPDGGRIGKVALLRLGSVTHAFDANQRYVELSYQVAGGGLDVTAPTSANVAPPGYYMLFLVDTSGVPSVSAMVRFPAPWEDSVPPSAPSNLGASSTTGRVDLTWTAATDDVGVTQYDIHREPTPGVVPVPANRVGQSATTSYTDTSIGATGTYYYVVRAGDARGNLGPPSNEVGVSVQADTTQPTVVMTGPAPSSTVSGVVTASASASDNVEVAGVQFLLDGAALGSEDTTAPHSIQWNTALTSNGPHVVSARARDAAGNTTTATNVPVTVSNSQVQGLVAAYSFDEGVGRLVRDSSGNANNGAVSDATWTTGHSASALSYDGAGDYVEVPNSASLDVSGAGLTIELWVNITDSTGPDYALLTKPWTLGGQGDPPYQYGVEFETGVKTLDFYFGDTTGTRRGPYSMTPQLGVWTHLAYTYDGATVRGYLDGVVRLSSSIAASIQGRGVGLRIGVDGLYGQGYRGKIDDVRIYNRALSQAEVQQDMVTPILPAVPPVPDGTFGIPMKPARENASGSTITLTWDTSGCVASGYHSLFGPLAGVSSYQLAGGVCGMGTSGNYLWTGVPPGNLWFVVVGDDTIGTEGDWGTSSTGNPMNGAIPSGVCGNTGRNNLGSCP